MGVSFTKRLIGKQDIAWDENGTGNERTYENPNTGAEYPVTDINAGDIPLTASTRTAIGGGVKDVDAALAAQETRLDGISQAEVLTEDRLYVWDASWSGDYVNENCPKDLGGHTVTIRFDDDMSLTEAVELTGFRNGSIVIEGQEHTLTDASDFGDGILRLENDLCEITVHEVTFDHDHTKYGVSLKSCPSVYFDECGFDGHATQAIETYGICAVLSTIDLSECSEANETENAEYYDSLKDYILAKLTARLNALEQKIQAEMVKAGQIVGFAGAGTVPGGFLLCDGSAVSRTTYAGLYTAIGTTYGEGDGSTTFNVPDFRGKFLRGYLDGTSGAIGTEQTDELKSHNHGYSATADYGGDGAKIAVADGFPSETLTGTVNSTGGSETRPVNFAVQWCIKT